MGLFGGPDLGGTRLPRRPDGREREQGDEHRARPSAHRAVPDQPLLPFGRPTPPARAPTTEIRPQAEAPASARPESPRLPALPPEPVAAGEVAKAKDLLEAIRILKRVEGEGRRPDAEERNALARFGGFGALALRLFPDPATGRYKSPGWEALGEELRSLLTEDELASARRTVFTAFYTSPTVIAAMYAALTRLGVSEGATVLEPGCGSGHFLAHAPRGMHFIGVELDALSGRIARALHPEHDIRIENFRDTRLPELDAVIGNPPFGDVRLDYGGSKLALHDFFLAKSLDALKPGGVLALVTSHYTLDKQNGAVREQLAAKADFLGAIRLPSDAFRREGTSVVTDLVFLRRRGPGESPGHADPAWLEAAPLAIEGVEVPINGYFHRHPEMVLGSFTRKDRLYGGDQGFSVVGRGPLADELKAAIGRLPSLDPTRPVRPATQAPRAVPLPPLLKHIAEGSFFVGDDRQIYQSVDGRPEPVVYGGTRLKANGTMMGKRLAHLIKLRDEARRVLQSQHEGWSEDLREAARRSLNDVYDRFVAAYGLVNKTTFSEAKDGTVITRMPNLAKFREDPDCMLVCSLEECEPISGTATKAPILSRDVVGRPEPVTAVGSAEEGLLVSLDQRGRVDLAFIAGLYGQPEKQVVEELVDLIYEDPESGSWVTADEYLSGNVRAKLAVAERAGQAFVRNAEALRAVQPEDVLPGDIDANLGAPWIPAEDVRAFAAQLFGVAASAVRVGHLKKDALWSVEADYAAVACVAATSDYGTARANGTTLLEQALNLKSPAIYDVVSHGDREERVLNQEQTLMAREKQARIKEAFRSWVFAEPDRAERLVRLYNDTYNNLRLRAFDGAHLDFPGMSRAVSLHPHQVDAVWRGMSSGNTLLAHVVGAGKTFTMAATGMKLKSTGLARKPMYVVPNHMLEQFSREFVQLYPDAKLLVATKDDLARERRKRLTAKMASGVWDGIIVTHSSFERIGMSRDYQARFLREQIAEYDELLKDTARGGSTSNHRNLIKQIEKQKARREERLKELLAEDKKDDGLVFDELGVDHLFIDEAHYFKNLETPTKMDRVAGIQTGGSERAFDLYMKARYLGEQHPGHGVTFATGTPISNSMVELYTLSRFLDPEGLSSRGIEHFDAWAATFGEVVDAMEISPDGSSLRPRSRFARFTNLPELQQLFRAFSDVQTAEMLDLPRPRLKGGKATVIACPMSGEQQAIQKTLVERYERLRSQKVDPREDNALAITTDGRKLALDARLILAAAPESPHSKIEALAANVARIWAETEPTRGTQLVFCDIGVNPTPWGYSVYEELIAKLVARGLPRGEVAAIGDADTDAKKQALFERVRNGTVRVLIGSTLKMGTGANVQRRLAALHHLDAPWKPAEVEQREGRILRQGNENAEVTISRYVTEGSFDAYMWQALETKARFIAQVMTGESGVRRADDIGGQELSYAEVKAIASGNPAVLTLAEADAELQRLSTLRKHHADEQFLARRHVRELPEAIAGLRGRLSDLRADSETLTANSDTPLIVGERPCRREDVVEVLGARLDALPELVPDTRRFTLGRFRGLAFGYVVHRNLAPEVFLEGRATRQATLSRDAHGPRAVLNALERLAAGYDRRGEELGRELSVAEGQLRDYQARLGAVFPREAYLAELSGLRDELRKALSAAPREPNGSGPASTEDLAHRIQALRATLTVEATPDRRPGGRAAVAERPVTTRIRARREAEAPQPAAAPEEGGILPTLAKVEVAAVETAPPAVDMLESSRSVGSLKTASRETRRKRYQKWFF
jgi:N12 class adenine-specific DNA methylase